MTYLPENVSGYIWLNASRKLTLRSAGASLSLHKKTQFQAKQCLQCSVSRHLVPACTNYSRNCSTVGLPAPSSGLSQKTLWLNLGYAIQRTSVQLTVKFSAFQCILWELCEWRAVNSDKHDIILMWSFLHLSESCVCQCIYFYST